MITEEQLKAIVGYLVNQPFKDVVNLINIIQSLPELPMPPVVNDKETI